MARLAVLAILLIGTIVVMGAPVENNTPKYKPLILPREIYEAEQKEAERKAAEQNKTDDHLRFRRVTCDLLSFGGKVGDSACAANCLSMGKAGGRCNGGVCQCRKTKFSDLWKDRFGGK